MKKQALLNTGSLTPKYHSVEIYENTPSGFVLFNAAEEEGTIKSKVLTGFEANMEELFAGHQ